MPIVCPRCRRNQPLTEEPPRYCSFCGQRLLEESEGTFVPGDNGSTVAHAPLPELPAEESTPSEIGGYRLLRLLGVGGMGRVFEAESSQTGERTAVKLLSTQLARNPTSVERFRQEGRLASQLSHPRCVFVYAADTENQRPYIVMELMPGDTLKDLIDRRGPLPPHEAIPLILDVIDGLREAHRFGVIHRDVKPSNCFLMPDGRVKIGDFGLSKSLGNNAQLTQSGAFLGTVLYASPEQIRGEPVEYASDVYSVCATLYHLLTGQPPFQHENITAALAKIISEDAPPIRSVRSDVPRALARIVEKGLERDRSRRWQTLEELRSALAAQLPSHLSYGGLTIRVGAFLLDEILVRLLIVLPLVGIFSGLTGVAVESQWVVLIVFPIYFTLLEGWYGASLGKRILGLRVCRIGSTDPPGLKRAVLRTLGFYLLVTVTLFPARALYEEGGGGWGALLIAAVPFISGLLLLIVPMRKKNDFRGLHELVSETCVLRLPRRPRPLALVSKRGDRMQAMPPPIPPLPSVIGPYAVKGAMPAVGGGWLVVGEDALLSRRILIRLRASNVPSIPEPAAVRPARLRRLSKGTEDVGGVRYAWEAFVAPLGAPLRDIVESRRLSWPETRPLLEQLADELAAAQADGSLPNPIALDQVWVQRDGRLQLLDFPVPRAGEMPIWSSGPLELLRDTATLALESGVRVAGSPRRRIQAAVPLHAAAFLDRLLGNAAPFENAAACAAALRETRDLPTHVDQRLRFAHLAVQALALGLGLIMMFLVSGLFAVMAYVERELHVRGANQILDSLDSPSGSERLTASDEFAALLRDRERFRAALLKQRKDDLAAQEELRGSFSLLERQLPRLILPPDKTMAPDAELRTARRAMHTPEDAQTIFERFGDWKAACILILFWPVVWTLTAVALRGGATYLLLGIGVVDRTGRPVKRRMAALRSLLVWTPVAFLLCASAWVQSHLPQMVNLHASCWFAALLLLPTYAGLALAHPDRPPQDRLLGTMLVPR